MTDTEPPPAPRGACPTLDNPMRVADGLLARFRPEAGLTPDQVAALAQAAKTYGNGLIEVTARGNLQIRGLSDTSTDAFRSALNQASIVAQPAPAIETSPIAGNDPKEVADPRSMARELRAVCDAALAKGPLSPKLSIVLASGGQVLLDGLKADIRLVARSDGWALDLGSTSLGILDEDGVPGAVEAILEALQEMGPKARGEHLHRATLAGTLTGLRPLAEPGARALVMAIGPLSLAAGAPGLRIGLPFGQVQAEQVEELARTMLSHGVTELHPAPDRTCVLLGFSAGALRDLAPALAALGYQTRPNVGMAQLSLCSGAERAEGGIIQAAEVAKALYATETDVVDGSFHLHVSTCAKGCPHAGRPGLVLDGGELRLYRAEGAKPLATLDAGAIETGVVSLAERIRDNRRSGETTLMVLDRLGHR